jgi:hypothetical protein
MLMSPAAFALSTRVGRALQKPFVANGRVGRLPLFLGKWTAGRDLPPIAARTFRERWKDLR